MLGLPLDDIPYFTRLVYSVSRFLSFTFPPDQLPVIQEDARELRDYVAALVADRSQHSGNRLASFLAHVGSDLSPIEVVVQVITLIIGGTDTTRVAMASQVSLLLQNREQWMPCVLTRLSSAKPSPRRSGSNPALGRSGG